MSFNTGAKLDPSQVEDVRGSRIGGRGLMVGGGGGIGIIVALVWVLLGGSPQTGETVGGLVGQTIGGGAGEPGPASSALAAECQTGADANAREDCRIVGYVNSIQAYWTDEFAASGQRYVPAKTRFFTDQISTGCGVASSASGPFYCPGDQYVYIDLGFFDELRSTVRRPGRPVRAGLRPRPRVRPPRPGPGRNAVGRDEPGGGRRAVGPDRAPGRLLRGRLGGQRGRDGLPRAAHGRRDRRCPRCRVGRRRRPDPAGDAGPGQPRDLDPRLVRPAPEVVHGRLPGGVAGRLRHVQRQPLRPGRSHRLTILSSTARSSGRPASIGTASSV